MLQRRGTPPSAFTLRCPSYPRHSIAFVRARQQSTIRLDHGTVQRLPHGGLARETDRTGRPLGRWGASTQVLHHEHRECWACRSVPRITDPATACAESEGALLLRQETLLSVACVERLMQRKVPRYKPVKRCIHPLCPLSNRTATTVPPCRSCSCSGRNAHKPPYPAATLSSAPSGYPMPRCTRS